MFFEVLNRPTLGCYKSLTFHEEGESTRIIPFESCFFLNRATRNWNDEKKKKERRWKRENGKCFTNDCDNSASSQKQIPNGFNRKNKISSFLSHRYVKNTCWFSFVINFFLTIMAKLVRSRTRVVFNIFERLSEIFAALPITFESHRKSSGHLWRIFRRHPSLIKLWNCVEVRMERCSLLEAIRRNLPFCVLKIVTMKLAILWLHATAKGFDCFLLFLTF